MFGHRSDGKAIKNINPFFKVIPNVMMKRSDSQVFFKQNISLKGMDEYINKKSSEGIKFSYMEIFFAAIVRTIYERPSLNRFAINGVLYERNKISISIAIKKNLNDDGQETTVKLEFDGTENIFEIKEKLNSLIKNNKKMENENNTDSFAKLLNKMSYGSVRRIVKFLKFLDKHGILPKKIIDLSPFHTSTFVTNVGSIGIDSIYHHLYDFGTTSLFVSMGKEKMVPVVDDDQVVPGKVMTLGVVTDERFCDGFYYISALKMLKEFYQNPKLLCERLETVEEDIPFDYKKNKKEAKEKKLKQKEEKRLEKAEIKKQKRKTK